MRSNGLGWMATTLVFVMVGALWLPTINAGPSPQPNSNAMAACEHTQGKPNPPPFCRGQSFAVVSQGPTSAEAAALASGLGLAEIPQTPDGTLVYFDEERFQHVPTIPAPDDPTAGPNEEGTETMPERFDFEALRNMPVYPQEDAMQRANDALTRAGLMPEGTQSSTAHATLEFLPVEPPGPESQIIIVNSKIPMDTQVNYDLMLGGLPLVGPGAKIKMNFDGAGTPTHVLYALRGTEAGPGVAQLSPDRGPEVCATAFGGQGSVREQLSPFDIKSRMVIYAPPLSMQGVKALYPHFECNGTMEGVSGPIQMRTILVPAVTSVPTVEVAAEAQPDLKGTSIHGEANVKGGTPPYTFHWSSLFFTIPPEAAGDGDEVWYSANGKTQTTYDVLTLRVTDANGLTAAGSDRVDIPPCCVFEEPIRGQFPGRIDVGVEFVGWSGNLPASAANAAGYGAGHALNNVPVQFYWGDFDAWEVDFKDPVFGGQDSSYVDYVDQTFYSGHASGYGWWFAGNNDDQGLDYWEGRFGNGDLEWLMIAACGPLQETAGGVSLRDRWGPAFHGLHLLAGYATVSRDQDVEGISLALYQQGGTFASLLGYGSSPKKVVVAWALMAMRAQDSDVTYGLMGPYSPSGVNNINDYFHGKGSVGPDLVGSNIAGFWVFRAPS
ncbi:MAG: hypothetical protein HYT80_05380 [Euryarchaeota archaeon]|nr:hypothetical protein [Euryarchaeota archaeon]